MPETTIATGTLFEATIATPTPVLRRDGWRPDNSSGPYHEVLPAAAADLSRLPGGPILLDHQMRSDLQVGVIEAASVRDGVVVAQLRFGSDPRARQIERDVAERTRRQVSVGYTVAAWDRHGGKDEIPTFEARAWTPMEVSVVPVGADPQARFRSEDTPTRFRTMTVTPSSAAPEVAPVTAPDTTLIERDRAAGISDIGQHLGLVAEAARMVSAGTDFATASRELARVAHQRQEASRVTSIHLGVTHDDPADKIERMAGALASRLSNGLVPVPPESREYCGASILDLGRELIVARGHRGFLGKAQVGDMLTRDLGGLHTTSDFATLLGNATNRGLLARFQQLPPALLPVARRSTVPDLRTIQRIRIGEGSGLSRVNEHGEVTRGTVADKGESYVIRTYAKIFGFTRDLILADDLGGLQDFVNNVSTKASVLLGDTLAAVLTTNAAMSDGTALFHANHNNNAAAPAAITTASLSIGRAAMRNQVGVDGGLVSVAPKYLIVGPAKESEAEAVLASIFAATPGTANIFSGQLTLIVEPRLTGNQWYLAADPAVQPGLEYAELDGSRQMGEPGPTVTTRVGFSTLGVEIRVVYDVGAGAIAFQSLWRNTGL